MGTGDARTHLVFVFGTLKQGFPNFHTNSGVRVPGEFITLERYPFYLVGERFSPWMIDRPGEGERVRGQVFTVDQAALERMDILERITEPDGYRRLRIGVASLPGAERLTVYAYLKASAHFDNAHLRRGPLSEYTVEHAVLYRSRNAALS